MESPRHLPGKCPPPTLLPATPLWQLCSILRGPNPNTGFAFPAGRSSGGGPAKATFQTGVWGEAEGPPEAPSGPAVPATCARCEDTPRGLGLQRPVPNSFSRSKGSSCRSSQAFADAWEGARPPSPPIPAVGLPVRWACQSSRPAGAPLTWPLTALGHKALWEFDGSCESSSQKKKTHGWTVDYSLRGLGPGVHAWPGGVSVDP